MLGEAWKCRSRSLSQSRPPVAASRHTRRPPEFTRNNNSPLLTGLQRAGTSSSIDHTTCVGVDRNETAVLAPREDQSGGGDRRRYDLAVETGHPPEFQRGGVSIHVLDRSQISSPLGRAAECQAHDLAIAEQGVDPASVGHGRGGGEEFLGFFITVVPGSGDRFHPPFPQQLSRLRVVTEHALFSGVASGQEEPVLPHHGRTGARQRNRSLPDHALARLTIPLGRQVWK